MAVELRTLASEVAFGKCVYDQTNRKRVRRFSIRSFQTNPCALIQRSIQFNSMRMTVLHPLTDDDGNLKQSLPTLVAIGLYERGLSAGQPMRESREATGSFYNSIRNMPLLEAIVGTGSNSLYDAIFDVDAMPEEELFGDLEEDERPALRSVASSTRLRGNRSRGRTPEPGPVPATNVQSPPMSPIRSPTRSRGTPNISPMMRPITISTANLLEPGEVPSVGKMSPLARLFIGDNPIRGRTTSIGGGAGLKKVETLLEDIKHLPVNKLTDEMRELQVRFIFSLVSAVVLRPRLWAVFIFRH